MGLSFLDIFTSEKEKWSSFTVMLIEFNPTAAVLLSKPDHVTVFSLLTEFKLDRTYSY